MFAHAILAVIAARERTDRPNRTRRLIPLTVNEIHHLFAKLITRLYDEARLAYESLPLALTRMLLVTAQVS